MSRRIVSYPRDMRDKAKATGRYLCTVDVAGLTFQGPCTREEALLVEECFKKLIELRNKKDEKSKA